MGLDLGKHRLDPLLEVAAVAGAGEQRAHVEGKDYRAVEHLRHLAVLDPPRQPLGERRLADAGIAHIERVVLGAAAEHWIVRSTSASRPMSGSIRPALALAFRLTQ